MFCSCAGCTGLGSSSCPISFAPLRKAPGGRRPSAGRKNRHSERAAGWRGWRRRWHIDYFLKLSCVTAELLPSSLSCSRGARRQLFCVSSRYMRLELALGRAAVLRRGTGVAAGGRRGRHAAAAACCTASNILALLLSTGRGRHAPVVRHLLRSPPCRFSFSAWRASRLERIGSRGGTLALQRMVQERFLTPGLPLPTYTPDPVHKHLVRGLVHRVRPAVFCSFFRGGAPGTRRPRRSPDTTAGCTASSGSPRALSTCWSFLNAWNVHRCVLLFGDGRLLRDQRRTA